MQRYLAEYGFDINANPPPGTFRRFAWWEATMKAPDQLRQRVAYALTQIFVVSDNNDVIFVNPLGLSSYYDMLLANAFGNFRDLLKAVTLHPVMGDVLEPRQQRKVESGDQHVSRRKLRARSDAAVLHRPVRIEQ